MMNMNAIFWTLLEEINHKKKEFQDRRQREDSVLRGFFGNLWGGGGAVGEDQRDIHLSEKRWIPGGFPPSSVGKESAWNAGDLGPIPGLGRSPTEGNGNRLQYSCLENPMDRGAWQAASMGSQESDPTEAPKHVHTQMPSVSGIVQYLSLRLANFTWHHVFKVHIVACDRDPF